MFSCVSDVDFGYGSRIGYGSNKSDGAVERFLLVYAEDPFLFGDRFSSRRGSRRADCDADLGSITAMVH